MPIYYLLNPQMEQKVQLLWVIFDVCRQIWALGLRAKAESAAFLLMLQYFGHDEQLLVCGLGAVL